MNSLSVQENTPKLKKRCSFARRRKERKEAERSGLMRKKLMLNKEPLDLQRI